MALAGKPVQLRPTICIPYTFMIYLFYSEILLKRLINWLTSSFLDLISFASFLALASLRLAARRALRSVSRRSRDFNLVCLNDLVVTSRLALVIAERVESLSERTSLFC